MKVTYTADDGTHFDSEADCRGWERFCKLRQEATDTLADPEDPESWDQDLYCFMTSIAGEEGNRYRFSGMDEVWRLREKLYQTAALMKQAEEG